MRLRALATAAVVPGALFATILTSSLHHHGAASLHLQLNPGTAWFADQTTGRVSLLDGATASRISEQSVPGARPGDNLLAVQSGVQSGSGAYVVDHTTGTVTRVDGATLQPARTVTFSAAGDGDLDVASDPAATWIISQKGTLAQEVDPTSLSPLGPTQPYASGAPVETSDGKLWTAGAGGYIYSYAGGLARTRTHPATGRFTLVEADSRPVAADTATGEAILLDPHSGQARRSVPFNPPGSGPIVTGSGTSPFLIAVDPAHAELQVTDVQNQRSSGTVVIGNPDAGYGPPVFSGNLIFVPSLDQAAVVVAEIQHDQLTVLGQVGVGDNHFNLFAFNNSVWFDDPTSDRAGVISSDLVAWAIPKTGGTGQGHRVGTLGPIHLSNGTTIKPTSPVKPSGLIAVHPIPMTSAGARSSPTGSQPATGTSSGTGSTGANNLPPGAPIPGFQWNPSNPRVRQPVAFTDTTTGRHRVFRWTFPSGSPSQSSSPSPTVTWSQPNTYNVILVVTDAGQSYAVQREVTVTNGAKPPPTSSTSSLSSSTTTTTTLPTHGTATTTSTSTTSTSTSTSSTSTTTTTIPPNLGYQVVENAVSLPAGGFVRQTADCPAGKVALGGGAAVVGAGTANFGTELQESEPGTVNLGTSLWLAAVSNHSSNNYTLGLFAVCANAPAGYQVVENAVSLPAGGFVRQTADCPAGKVALGGGAAVVGAGTANFGTELQESDPGTVNLGTSLWLAAVSNHSSNNYTLGLFAVCANSA